MNYYFAWGRKKDATNLVLECHYSSRMPNCKYVGTVHSHGGLFGDLGECVAACCFGIPPTRWGEDVLELNRLVRSKSYDGPLTKLISWTVKNISRFSDHDLLVSFADPTHNHHGGIYQAASWNFHGQREPRMDGCVVDGKFVPGRSCNSHWGTQSPTRLSGMLGKKVEPHFDKGKYLYWKPINKNGRKKSNRLGLMCKPYPKPDDANK